VGSQEVQFSTPKKRRNFPWTHTKTQLNCVGLGKVSTFFGRRGIFPLELPGPITEPENEGIVSTERT
jgi:hypothetical protein